MIEKYYVCPNCGDLRTESELAEEVEFAGGNGMCMCEFMATDPDTGEV